LIDIVPKFPLDSPKQLSSERGWVLDDLMRDLVEHQRSLLVLFFDIFNDVGLSDEEFRQADQTLENDWMRWSEGR